MHLLFSDGSRGAGMDELLTLNDIAELARVSRQTAQKWHGLARKTAGAPPLHLVAKAMGVPIPEAHGDAPRYPRSVVIALLQAVGYMDADETLMERRGGRGPWTPTRPTIDPHPPAQLQIVSPEHEQPAGASGEMELYRDRATGRRLRYYTAHAWQIAGYGSQASFKTSLAHGRGPAPDGIDELERPFWFRETLEAWAAGAENRKAVRYAGRAPDGYTPQGQPFRLLPDDNYYAMNPAEPADQTDKGEPPSQTG